MKRLILASASPRRRELIERLGYPVDVMVSRADESIIPGESPESFAVRVAMGKAEEVAARVPAGGIVLGMDTVVVLGGQQMGKPDSPIEARDMLEKLSGRSHEVLTGVGIVDMCSGRRIRKMARTEVTFKSLTSAEIERYIAGGEPLDKAGAYGIQGVASLFVERINGCYYNVVGLPLNLLYETLLECGFSPAF